MKTIKALTIILLLCALIIFWGWRERSFYKQLEAERNRIPTVEEWQQKLNNTGIGDFIPVDGKLSQDWRNSKTQTKWDLVNSRQLGDRITEFCWNKSGAYKK